LNLAIRAIVARNAMEGIAPSPEILRGLAGRLPDTVLRDFERRIVRAGALGLSASPLDEAELGTMAADLQRVSAFDALLAGGANVVPLRGSAAFVSTAATGTTAANGSIKRITSLAFDAAAHEPTVALAFLVITNEMLIGLEGPAVLERELVKAAGHAADTVLVAALTAGTPASAASSGVFARDVNAAVAGFPDNSGGRIFVLVAPSTCRQLATVDDGDGHLLHPDIDPGQGGTLGAGIRVVPTSALAAEGSADPDALVVDATALALAASAMGLTLSTEASLQMTDTPSDSAANLVSLFQTDSTAYRAERSVVASLIRENAVAIVEGVNYVGAGS
jgi:HK97 family phage major capsid protein